MFNLPSSHIRKNLMTLSSASSIVGIDLGTTNSVVAIYDAGTARVIPNKVGSYTTPSVVAYTKDRGNTPVVGALAKRQRVLNPENTFYSVKRLIGCNFEEIKNEIPNFSYTIRKESDGKIKIFCSALDKEFSPEQISSVVLKSLLDDASTFLNKEVTKAVVTVPAYFNDSQRQATKDAGAIAGIEVVRILNEPTAAALAYGLDKKKNETVLIFDLGGGTFDVSVLEVGQEVFEVLSTSGDTHLGGDDFDNVIVAYVIENFKKQHGIDLYKDKQAHQRIIEASEKAKIELSTLLSTEIDLPFISSLNGQPLNINVSLDRSKFEELSKDLFKRCEKPLEQAITDSNLKKEAINQAVLVGGSTRIPAVKNLLKNYLGKSLNESVNPDEVVALGAAIQAGIIAGQITDLILLDVTPLSLGVETLGGIMTPVLVKNTPVPAKQSEIFSTAMDSQDTVDVHILQGERSLAKDNKSLGTFKLMGIPPAPKGMPRINVTFQLDADGILSVTASEESSGVEQSIRIEGSSVLDRNDVKRMIQEAEINANRDKLLKFNSSLTYQLDSIFFAFENFDLEAGKKLTTSEAYEVFSLAVKELQNAYIDNDYNLIRETLILLENSLNEFIEDLVVKEYLDDQSPNENNEIIIDV